jgi:3-oxoacyl-(acyl-carrier-protein) synthase
MLLSQDGYRPFDARRDGLILGEAAGAVVLSKEPPEHGPITQILGGANRCAPENPTNAEAGQLLRVMRLALQQAGVTQDELIAIKAHGTGTPSNDRAEGQALDQFSVQLPPITSLKPYFGHTLGACGLSELVGLLYAWDEGFLPATPGFEISDEEFSCQPITQPQALPASGAVLLNSFGFGGNNTSLVIRR